MDHKALDHLITSLDAHPFTRRVVATGIVGSVLGRLGFPAESARAKKKKHKKKKKKPSKGSPPVVPANVCPSNQALCGATCTDIYTSVGNCGRCGKACGIGEVCGGGVCQPACPNGRAVCINFCCNLGEVCSIGQCVVPCSTGGVRCGTGCCAVDEICLDGACAGYEFVTSWGEAGSGDGEFDGPVGIAVDAAGNVYVMDSGNERVQKYDIDLDLVLEWDTRGFGLAVANGVVYVANGWVSRFHVDGDFIEHWTSGMNGAADVSLDSMGFAYAINSIGDNVVKLNGSGQVAKTWGGHGSDFSFPDGIAVDSDAQAVYVADTFNNRIQKFDLNGNYLTQWGSFGSGNGQFKQPAALAIDHAGRVLVADFGNNRVQVFGADGAFKTAFGTTGTGNGEFRGPAGIAVDGIGDILVTDTNNNRVQKFSPVVDALRSRGAMTALPEAPRGQADKRASTSARRRAKRKGRSHR